MEESLLTLRGFWLTFLGDFTVNIAIKALYLGQVKANIEVSG